MPTVIAIRFPFGRYHGTPWGRHVNEGAVEWPPSPWRLLRALYATWQARAPELPASDVETLLTKLAAPPEYEVPPFAHAHTRHYLPDETHMSGMPKRGSTSSYSDDATDKTLDAFTAVPRDQALLVRWEVELDSAERSALTELCRLTPYLGRAESLCTIAVGDTGTTVSGPGATRCAPLDANESGSAIAVLTAIVPLVMASLTTPARSIRPSDRRSPPGTEWTAYSALAAPMASRAPRRRGTKACTAIRWSIDTTALPSRYAALVMADVLRQACLSQAGKRLGRHSEILVGKTAAGRPLSDHHHAHYIAFGAGVRDRSGHRLDTLVVWAPGGMDDDEVAAVTEVRGLFGHDFLADFRPCRLGLEGFGDVENLVPELVGPHRLWASHTPFVPTRHAHKRVAWTDHVRDEVGRELGFRAKPVPRTVDVLQGDWLNYRTHRPSAREMLAEAPRGAGVRVEFSEPQSGPLLLGASSHFGLGLLRPVE